MEGVVRRMDWGERGHEEKERRRGQRSLYTFRRGMVSDFRPQAPIALFFMSRSFLFLCFQLAHVPRPCLPWGVRECFLVPIKKIVKKKGLRNMPVPLQEPSFLSAPENYDAHKNRRCASCISESRLGKRTVSLLCTGD